MSPLINPNYFMNPIIIPDNSLVVVNGAQWGDEGKGKKIDYLNNLFSEEFARFKEGLSAPIPVDPSQMIDWGKQDASYLLADPRPIEVIVARWGGGPNAGHSVEVDGLEIILHGIPSGVLNPRAILYIGQGCVVNPEKLVKEIDDLSKKNISLEDRLHISPHALIIQPAHIIEDGVNVKTVGATGNGIAPTVVDHFRRKDPNDRQCSLTFADYYQNPEWAKTIIKDRLNALMPSEDTSSLMNKFIAAMDRLKQYYDEDPYFIQNRLDDPTTRTIVIAEGAQGLMLDPRYGTFPNVTSCLIAPSAVEYGLGIPAKYQKFVIAVAKVILSRVGKGPFPSEIGGIVSENHCLEEDGKKYIKAVERAMYSDVNELLKSDDPLLLSIAMRMIGGEYGATTCRPRRVGIWDQFLIEHLVKQHQIDGLVLTKTDLLNVYSQTKIYGASGMPVVTGYRNTETGISMNRLPLTDHEWRSVEPIVDYLPHIPQFSGAKNAHDLPRELLGFVEFVEAAGVPVLGVGTGPGRNNYVPLREIKRAA